MPSNRLIIKVFFLFLISHILACCSGCVCEHNCSYTELASIEVAGLDNSGRQPVQPTDTISALAFELQIKFYGKAPVQSCLNSWKKGLRDLSNPAMAFKCEAPRFESPDTISSLQIYSTSDFNTEYPIGSDLSDLFEVEFQSPFDNDRYMRVDGIDSTSYWPPERFARYYLFNAPDQISSHQFIVIVEMKNGSSFSDTTESIYLR